MTFAEHLVLWLHVAFVVFTIGPVTLAIMSTPRYIRQRDIRIVRYLSRMTFVFTLVSLGVLVAGMFLAQMLSDAAKPWIIVSATLFLVAVLLLGVIVRDQRKAIKALEAAAAGPSVAAGPADEQSVAAQPDGAGSEAGLSPAHAGDSGAHIATVERGRIAMTGGLVSLIWLVILVLMIWNS